MSHPIAIMVGPREDWAVRCLDMLPWASAGDLARCCGRSGPVAYHALANLERAGLARCFGVSSGGGVCRRFVLSDRAAGGRLRRHQPALEQRCCGNLALVEGAYRLLGDVVAARSGRRLEEFRWVLDGACDGVARFDDGWCVVLWSGRSETLGALRRRLRRLVDRGFPGGGWPGLWCFVGSDLFQAHLALRAAGEVGLDSVAAAAGGGPAVGSAFSLTGSRSWWAEARRPAEGPAAGAAPEAAGPGALWMGAGARRALRVLGAVEDWPGADGPLLQRLTGCSRWGFRSDLFRLRVDGLLADLPRGGYGCGPAWRAYASRRDGVAEREPAGLLTGRWRREWARCLGAVAASGAPVAPGWRAAGWFEGPAPDLVVGVEAPGGVSWEGVWGLAEARTRWG